MRGRKKKTTSRMKRANGTGSVYKLPGNRRKPWIAIRTVGYSIENDKTRQIRETIGYYETEQEAWMALENYNLDPYDLNTTKTFAEVYEEWTDRYFRTLKNRSTERTITAAYNYTTILQSRNIKDITITMLKDCIDNAEVGASTRGRMKSMFNLMYDYAVESEYVPVNIARQFTIKTLQKQIQKEHKDKIPFSEEHIKLCHDHSDYGYMKMVLIGLYTGLRPQEICLLLKDNIHLDENYIIAGMKTDAGTDRYVPIHPQIRPYLEYYMNNSKSEYVIEADDGQGDTIMTYDKYRRRFQKCMKAIGAEGLYSPHCTRHTFITQAKVVQMDDVALKTIVGHEISDITESVYTHRTSEFIQEEFRKFHYLKSQKALSHNLTLIS